MKSPIFIVLLLLVFYDPMVAQSKVLYGRVISNDLEKMPFVEIQSAEEKILGKTDLEGRFKIELSQNSRVLLFRGVGLEAAKITVTEDCDTIGVVMILASTYDFMSPAKVDKERLKEFKKLPEIYSWAYKEGLFAKSTVCYSRAFEPHWPNLEYIKKERSKQEAINKDHFNKFKIGDTVRIPFNGQKQNYGSGKAILYQSSYFSNQQEFNCILEAVIIGKNRYNKGYNLVCRVTGDRLCKMDGIYKGKSVKVGEVFEYDMKYFKIMVE